MKLSLLLCLVFALGTLASGPCDAFPIKGVSQPDSTVNVYGSTIGVPATLAACGTQSFPQVWYTITDIPYDAQLTLYIDPNYGGGSFFPQIAFASQNGTCSDLHCIFSTPFYPAYIRVGPGVVYYFSVGSPSGQGDFHLEVSLGEQIFTCPPTFPVAVGGSSPVIIDATTSGAAAVTLPCGSGATVNAVWYSLTSLNERDIIQISTCNSATEVVTNVVMLSGACGHLLCPANITTTPCTNPVGVVGSTVSFEATSCPQCTMGVYTPSGPSGYVEVVIKQSQ